MATTPNYGFIMPDPTDFVTDLPADFEIFGDEVDSRIKALNPETTAGDISYRGATANAKVRLPIGTAGQVLRVNSGATAPEWGTATAAATSFSLLNSGNVTLPTNASSFTVSGLTSFNNYRIFFRNVSSATSAAFGQLRINASSGANYNFFGYNFINSSTFASTNLDRIGELNATEILFARQAGTNAWSGSVHIEGGNSTGNKIFHAWSGATGDGGRIYDVSGYWNNTASITSIQVFTSSGNFSGGEMYIYGGN